MMFCTAVTISAASVPFAIWSLGFVAPGLWAAAGSWSDFKVKKTLDSNDLVVIQCSSIRQAGFFFVRVFVFGKYIHILNIFTIVLM
jgi:hypothetical protein